MRGTGFGSGATGGRSARTQVLYWRQMSSEVHAIGATLEKEDEWLRRFSPEPFADYAKDAPTVLLSWISISDGPACIAAFCSASGSWAISVSLTPGMP